MTTFARSCESANGANVPSGAFLAPYLLRLRDPAELPDATLRDENRSFFAGLRPLLARWSASISATIAFERFGFATARDFSTSDEFFGPDASPESFLFEEIDGELRFFLVAPARTFRAVFDALLGFDVARIEADSFENAGEFGPSDRRLAATSLERQTASAAARAFARRLPSAAFWRDANDASASESESSPEGRWRLVAARPFSPTILEELNDAFYYWERRAVVWANRRFSWRTIFPISPLGEAWENAFSCENRAPVPVAVAPPVAIRRAEEPEEFGNFGANEDAEEFGIIKEIGKPEEFGKFEESAGRVPDNDRRGGAETRPSETSNLPTEAALDFATEPTPTSGAPIFPLEFADASERRTVELSVEIASATVRADVWRALKAGDVLPTNATSSALFLTKLDGATRYWGLPGLFHGAPAVQIKQKIGPSERAEGPKIV